MMSLYTAFEVEVLKMEVLHIPVLFIVFYIASLCVANDVRHAFQKVLWYHKREDKLPIWQVGMGMLFFFSQIGLVEVFMRQLMTYKLDGMPLYFIFAFLNAFLCTVIYQEIFYVKKESYAYKVKSNK